MPKPKPVARIVTVPGGSNWYCGKCGGKLITGQKVLKLGKEVYCFDHIGKDRITGG